ncbi:MAG: ATP-dependent protease LonB [Bacillota bacterium]|nr:ATP-dependent protease LonB [Bacillota bacterium]
MTQILILIEIFFTVVIGLYFLNALKGQKTNKITVNVENKRELENLKKMRDIKLSIPLTERGRPTTFDEIIGQEKGIKALKAAICGTNPQHIIIYGPPGVGKTAAARLVLHEAKKKMYTPFRQDARFVEIDATTVHFDDRGIADPLIGSVHDPIYQGAGALGIAGIPQPKPGAVTKAHGGILFIDEIGELHPIELNKLLKVLEDRKVLFDSSYYNSSDPNMPTYIREVFENGMPADFRLIGATTRNPEEISPALRSRCVEIFFRPLHPEEIEVIARNSVKKIDVEIDDEACSMVGRFASNGREAVNIVQLAAGIALDGNRRVICLEDIEWVIENGQYSPRPDKKVNKAPQIGYVNGLAVYGANMGAVMEIESSAHKVKGRKGNLKVTGIVDEEEITTFNRKIRRKSNALCSVENVITVLEKRFNINCDEYDIHVNFPGGVPVDGPSAGISIATAIYSAIKGIAVDNKVAMTGEIALNGNVKPIGGVNAKIAAAQKAGAKRIIVPRENYQESFQNIEGVSVIPVDDIEEVFKISLNNDEDGEKINIIDQNVDILSADGLEKY